MAYAGVLANAAKFFFPHLTKIGAIDANRERDDPNKHIQIQKNMGPLKGIIVKTV